MSVTSTYSMAILDPLSNTLVLYHQHKLLGERDCILFIFEFPVPCIVSTHEIYQSVDKE